MTLRDIFGRQAALAQTATPLRRLLTWGELVVFLAVVWFWPTLLPWWGWLLVGAASYVGSAFLGRYWADKDLALAESAED